MWEEFNETLASLAGPEAIDCGHLRQMTEASKEFDCGQAAFQAGRALRISHAFNGIDSWVVGGIAVNSRNEYFLVIGDSDITGGGGPFGPKPAVKVFMCSRPLEFPGPRNFMDCPHRKEI
jgi:hypothetical protein